MKRSIRKLFSLIGIISVLVVVNSACTSSKNEWPTVDAMKENLQKKDYTIMEDSKIIIDNNEYEGTVIIATKDSEMVAGFWGDDVETAKIVYEYWGEKYQSDHTLRVGTTVFCGSKQAIKHAGIKL